MYKAPIKKKTKHSVQVFMDKVGYYHTFFTSLDYDHSPFPYTSQCTCGWYAPQTSKPDEKNRFGNRNQAVTQWMLQHKNNTP